MTANGSRENDIVLIHLPPPWLRRLKAHAEQSYPRECCGLLLGETDAANRRTVLDVQAVRNPVADEGVTDRYRIEPADYLRADRRARSRGWHILGCYHSHPDEAAVPSATDLACAWPWYVYLIVAVHEGRVVDTRGWMLNDKAEADAGHFQPVRLATG